MTKIVPELIAKLNTTFEALLYDLQERDGVKILVPRLENGIEEFKIISDTSQAIIEAVQIYEDRETSDKHDLLLILKDHVSREVQFMSRLNCSLYEEVTIDTVGAMANNVINDFLRELLSTKGSSCV